MTMTDRKLGTSASDRNLLPKGRMPDLHNLPKPGWRETIKALVGPAARIHHYRNLHRSMFYDAVAELDCGECK